MLFRWSVYCFFGVCLICFFFFWSFFCFFLYIQFSPLHDLPADAFQRSRTVIGLEILRSTGDRIGQPVKGKVTAFHQILEDTVLLILRDTKLPAGQFHDFLHIALDRDTGLFFQLIDYLRKAALLDGDDCGVA